MLFIITILGFAIATLISVVAKKRRIMEVASVAASVVALVSMSVIAYQVGTTGEVYSPLPFVSIDSMGAIAGWLVGVVGCANMLYAVPYFGKELAKQIVSPRRVKKFYILTNVFLGMLLLCVAANNPVLAWILLEATSLSTVFLINYYNKPSTIEAAWKYLIISSIGLLLGFLGTLLYFTALGHQGSIGLISWNDLLAQAGQLNLTIAKVAFALVMIGYGTKVGLAPMHTWKPDAYSKAPAPIGALFSGALLPVAFLLILRFRAITDAAVGVAFSQHLLIGFGLLSIVIAAFSIMVVGRYKRLLAYSTIEHTGIIALGFGFGGIGAFAAVLHMIYHSMIKSSMFFATGNILLKYSTAHIKRVTGALGVIPSTSVLFFIGFLAVTGLPPFGIFLTELMTLSAGVSHYPIIVAIALIAMVTMFVGLFKHISGMVLSEPPSTGSGIKPGEDSNWLLVMPAAMLVLVLILSFYVPPFLQTLIQKAIGQ
ncbi:MAG TPA: proton-conducting transporter membrane subunit [Patescibacteria group bacterium]|jgi:hydrogenase-4 component F|nr:proton-conducting transporter membrane subunit [Patescibacteria group bacterium]